jgi:Holliday junction resolvase RusA-like endonuclease
VTAPLTVTTNLPNPKLMGNGRCGPIAKNALFQAYKTVAYLDAKNAMGPRSWRVRWLFPGPCRVRTTWHIAPKGKEPDGDNALFGLKAVWDAFTAAGVWPDDKGNQYLPITFTRGPVPGFRLGAVVIEIQPLEDTVG